MAVETVNVHLSLEKRLKEEAEAVFARNGLDAAAAVSLFYDEVAKSHELPFAVADDWQNNLTPEQEAEYLKAYEESFDPANFSEPFENVGEMFKHLKAGTIE